MFFILPLPPGINQTYGTNKSGNFYKKSKAKQWEEDAGWIIKANGKRKRFQEACSVQLHVFYHPHREPDIDAYAKICLDLLQNTQILSNDKIVRKLVIEKFEDGRDPRLEVTIS